MCEVSTPGKAPAIRKPLPKQRPTHPPQIAGAPNSKLHRQETEDRKALILKRAEELYRKKKRIVKNRLAGEMAECTKPTTKRAKKSKRATIKRGGKVRKRGKSKAKSRRKSKSRKKIAKKKKATRKGRRRQNLQLMIFGKHCSAAVLLAAPRELAIQKRSTQQLPSICMP